MPQSAPAPSARPSIPAGTSFSRADSQKAGFFLPSRQGLRPGPASLLLVGGSPAASVANVTPGWYQGAAQPQTITITLNGPVNSVTVTGDGAINCSGTFGTLIGYDKNGAVLGAVPLSLLYQPDCGSDDLTYGATATLSVSQGIIARVDITPMSPLNFTVDGVPGGRASANYSLSLGTYPSSDYPPFPQFTASCNSTTFDCTLDASGSQDDFGIASYAWSLGKAPGGSATGVSVTTSYWHASWRSVTLTVTDTKGQTSSLTKWIGVGVGLPPGQPPVANIVANCTGLSCTLTDNAVGSTPSLFRTWDFSNGVFLNNVASPSITFQYGGIYYVQEKIVDANGVVSFAGTSFYVIGPPPDALPVAAFTWTCAGQAYPHQCAFNAGGSFDDVGIVSYKWDWGNGRTETKAGTTTRNTWASAGTYQVTLTVTDTKGQKGSLTQSVVVP